MTDPVALRETTTAVTLALQGLIVRGTENIMFYHAKGSRPPWAIDKTVVTKIGNHIFYN